MRAAWGKCVPGLSYFHHSALSSVFVARNVFFAKKWKKKPGRIVRRIQRARHVEFWWGLEKSKKQVNDAPLTGYTVSDPTNHTAFSGHVIVTNNLLNSVYDTDKTIG